MADSPSFEELERHFETASLALGRGDRAAAAEALRAIVRDAEVRDDAVEPLTIALTRLGELELEDGREADAEAHFQRALALGERRLGAEHPDLVVLLNALSRLYLRRGAHELAEPILQRLYAIKRTKGEDHPEVATVLASLANVRQALGRHDAAEQLWRRVLEIRERTLAPNHVATASALERLAETCAARAKPGEAVQLMQRALAMRELTLGASHPTVRALRERIADLQLQAADEDTGGDGFGPLVPRTSETAIPAWRSSPSLPIPAIPMPPAAPFAPAPVATATRSMAMPYAPPSAMTTAAAAAEPDAKPPMSLILPGAGDGGLALQQLLAEIDAEAEAAANRPSVAARTMTLLREHRRPAIIAGVLVLLGAAVTVARARGTQENDDPMGDLMRRSAATATTLPAGVATPAYGAEGVVTSAATAARTPDAAATGALPPRPEAEHPVAHEAAREPQHEATGEQPRRPAERATEPARTAAPALAAMPALRLDNITSAASAATATVTRDPVANRLVTMSEKAAALRPSAPSASTGTNAQPARLMGNVPVPRYPQSLRQSGVEGEVRVTFEVDTTGRPDMRTLVVLKSDHELFTRAVRGVIPEMRFVPAEVDGKKARWLVRMPFQFSVGR